MSSLVFLVPISLALLGVAIWAFVWAVRRGQFDDLETPAVQILVDEPPTRPTGPTPARDAAGDSKAGPPEPDAADANPGNRPTRAD